MKTRAEQIAQTMASMGFRPDWKGDPHVVEYVKDYAEPDGRIARLTCSFSKAGYMSVMDQARLVGFTVTVQGRVDPLIESVRGLAPKALQPDMLAALAHLEGITEPEEDPVAHCGACGEALTEWTVSEQGQVTCLRPDVCPAQKMQEGDE